MAQKIRFGDFAREVTIRQRSLSYNDLTPKAEFDTAGTLVPYRPARLRPTPRETYNLLEPYVSVRLIDQVRAVAPLALYLVLFQLVVLRQTVADAAVITGGFVAVILGLTLFMEGLKLGLMPFAEELGDKLPRKSRLRVVLAIAFILGIGVTFAEPAIGALQAVGAIVDVRKAPYLYALLNDWAPVLVLMVGIGVGLAAVLGTLRFLFGWSLKPYIYVSLVPTLALTLYCAGDPELAKIIALAWDCGAVTTGPVTVPLVLSLGIGIAAAGGSGQSSLSGFGIVTLASLFPILAVMVLALWLSFVTTPEAIVAAALAGQHAAAQPAWHETSPWVEVIGGLRAIVPLVAFLFLVLRALLRETLHEAGIVAYGLALSVLGMIVFNLGLTYGLAKLGGQAGGLVPAAFAPLAHVEGAPLYHYAVGVGIALVFAWILGFGATLAEPALNALGSTVEDLTNGAFKKRTLMYAVSVGVAFGLAIGVIKIIHEVPLAWLLVPLYLLAALLTALSSEEFVNVAWDSAGVTTGPVTVPMVLAMGVGFGNAVSAIEGFGILSAASICPILSVLLTGLWLRLRAARKAVAEQAEATARTSAP